MPQTHPIIRPARQEDAQNIADFNSLMAMETENKALQPAIILGGVNNLIRHPEYGFYLVAEAKDTIVGSLMVTTEWSDWRNGLFWWIQSVYVRKTWRRQGIYRQLYESVQALAAQKTTVCGFRLYVEKDNVIAQQTYESLGMAATDYLLYEAGNP